MSGAVVHTILKQLALAATVALIVAYFAPPLVAATAGCAALYVVLVLAG